MLVKKGRWPTRRQQDRANQALCCKAARVCGQRLAGSYIQIGDKGLPWKTADLTGKGAFCFNSLEKGN